MKKLLTGFVVVWLGWASVVAQTPASVVVLETTKGSISFEMFPKDAPATVAHITALVKSGFYDGQRFHRAIPGFLVQFGDPQSRDLSKRASWGRGQAAASGKPVGVAEINLKRLHRRGSVGIAHQGNPAQADSQIYIVLATRKDLDGQYAIFGQVISGDAVLDKLEMADVITRAYLKP